MADKSDGKASTRVDAARPRPDASGATRFIDARRREFLQGAALAAGAAAGGTTLAASAADGTPSGMANEPASAGYRVTDHVREYYAKARF